jgi:4-amino-4-deoxy-L-arabinose transferase-like glycosyltransferase
VSWDLTTERSSIETRAAARIDQRVLWVIALAILVRLAFLALGGAATLQNDELQYQEIATNLVAGNGYALDGHLTSWRPPLYPAMLAVLYEIAGSTDPFVARVAQAGLSLVTALLVLVLTRSLFGQQAAFIAFVITAFYPSSLFYANHLLTEGLFTLLVTLTAVCFAGYLASDRWTWLPAIGAVSGLAALARDVFLPVVGLLALVTLVVRRHHPLRAVAHVAVIGAIAAAIIAPWTVRNYRVFGTFTPIATNGGPSFLAGNNEFTPLDRPWQYQEFSRDQRWRTIAPETLNEGRRQQVAYQKAFEFIREHPGLTFHRGLIKAANVWGLEREVVGTILKDGYGRAARSLATPAAVVIMGAYAGTLLVGLTGLTFAVARGTGVLAPFHVFFAGLVAFVTLVHAGAFGHPRYHLPLMPVFAGYAAYAWTIRSEIWRARRSRAVAVVCALAVIAFLIWGRELILEMARFRGMLAD